MLLVPCGVVRLSCGLRPCRFYESDYSYFSTIANDEVLRTELFCASMMMVRDSVNIGGH